MIDARDILRLLSFKTGPDARAHGRGLASELR